MLSSGTSAAVGVAVAVVVAVVVAVGVGVAVGIGIGLMDVTPFDVDTWVGGPAGLSALSRRGARTPSVNGTVHLTEVLAYIDDRFGYSAKSRRGDDAWAYAAAVGFAFEDALSAALAGSCAETLDLVRHFEVERDGVVGSPDGYDPATAELYEIKYTWRSLASSPPESTWRWMAQVKGYCYLMETAVCWLIALYGNGDWRPPAPKLVGIRLVFTPMELTENWRMVQEGRAELLKSREERP